MNRSRRCVKSMLLGILAALPFMAMAKAVASAPPTLTLDRCSWDHPGVNPFMGDVVAAVDRYGDIPADVRERLKARMEKRDYDDLVEIRRDSMIGRGGYDYGNTITDMHFGTHQVCRTVTRNSWTPQMLERGLVYCESGHCILVPTVCRNVSRVTRRGVGPAAAEAAPLLGTEPPVAALAPPPAMADDLPPIDWDGPTGAGPLEAGPIGHADGVPALAGPEAGGAPNAGWYGLPVIVPGLIGGSGGGSTLSSVKPPVGTDGTPLPPPAPPPAVLTPVPEPQTWALMLAGLAACALVRRRAGRR